MMAKVEEEISQEHERDICSNLDKHDRVLLSNMEDMKCSTMNLKLSYQFPLERKMHLLSCVRGITDSALSLRE